MSNTTVTTTKVYYRLIRDKGIISSFIAWWTWGIWSHCEFITDKGYLGSRLSGGVAVRPFNYCTPVYEEIRCIEMPNNNADNLWKFLNAQLGKPYDVWAIIGLGIRNNFSSNGKSWFCSELVIAGFQAANINILNIEQDYRVTPRDVGLSPIGSVIKYNPYSGIPVSAIGE
jgi:uncharacterized protein YycO